jgi:hypothetical protein
LLPGDRILQTGIFLYLNLKNLLLTWEEHKRFK